MTTKQTTPESIEQLSAAEQRAAQEAAKAQAVAQEAATKAEAARQRAAAERTAARKRYALNIRTTNKERRPQAVTAVTKAREAFAAAVVAGESFGPAYLELVQAEAALYTHELEYVEALQMLGQSAMRWPEWRVPDLMTAIADALKTEANRIVQEQTEAMQDARAKWIAQQIAGDANPNAETTGGRAA